MNAPFDKPTRRELMVAAITGLTWALLGYALAAHGAQTPFQVASSSLSLVERAGERGEAGTRLATSPLTPLRRGEGKREAEGNSVSCRIHNHLGDGSTNVGSGTLIEVAADGRRGLVLTCAHLFTEGAGQIVVEFPGGRTHGANLAAIDRDADLAALAIATPPGPAAPMAFELDPSSPLEARGFGPNGQFRRIAGPMLGAVQSPGQESVQISGAVRSGDSGGGVFDVRGRLVAVVWGERDGVTYATAGGPLRRFLHRVLGGRGAVREPLASTTICPNGRCPFLPPGVLGETPPARPPAILGGAPGRDALDRPGCGCGDDLAAIASRLDALENANQDKGDFVARGELAPYARAEELAQLDRAARERHRSLLKRLGELGPLVGAAARAAAPVAATTLGVSGPIGWALLAATSVGGWLVGRRSRAARRELREKRKKPATDSSPLATRTSKLPTPPEATADADHSFRVETSRVETRQPVERDDREARELLRLSQFEGRDPLQDALAGRLALDRLDAAADGDADPQRARWADDLRRELRERFNDVAPTKMTVGD